MRCYMYIMNVDNSQNLNYLRIWALACVLQYIQFVYIELILQHCKLEDLTWFSFNLFHTRLFEIVRKKTKLSLIVHKIAKLPSNFQIHENFQDTPQISILEFSLWFLSFYTIISILRKNSHITYNVYLVP